MDNDIIEGEPTTSNFDGFLSPNNFSESDTLDRSDDYGQDDSDEEEIGKETLLYKSSNIKFKDSIITINLLKVKHGLSEIAINIQTWNIETYTKSSAQKNRKFAGVSEKELSPMDKLNNDIIEDEPITSNFDGFLSPNDFS